MGYLLLAAAAAAAAAYVFLGRGASGAPLLANVRVIRPNGPVNLTVARSLAPTVASAVREMVRTGKASEAGVALIRKFQEAMGLLAAKDVLRDGKIVVRRGQGDGVWGPRTVAAYEFLALGDPAPAPLVEGDQRFRYVPN